MEGEKFIEPDHPFTITMSTGICEVLGQKTHPQRCTAVVCNTCLLFLCNLKLQAGMLFLHMLLKTLHLFVCFGACSIRTCMTTGCSMAAPSGSCWIAYASIMSPILAYSHSSSLPSAASNSWAVGLAFTLDILNKSRVAVITKVFTYLSNRSSTAWKLSSGLVGMFVSFQKVLAWYRVPISRHPLGSVE